MKYIYIYIYKKIEAIKAIKVKRERGESLRERIYRSRELFVHYRIQINFTRRAVNQSSQLYNGWALNHSAVIAPQRGIRSGTS